MHPVKDIIDNIQGKKPWLKKRNKLWYKVRKIFLKDNCTCAVCGGNKKIEVHHIKPFYLFPELELDINNLITLCENKKYGVNCHLLFGHLGDYKKYNINVINDVKIWKDKLQYK